MKKTFFLLLLIAAVVAGAYYWKERQGSGAAAPLDVKTAKVTRGDIVQSVTANGQLTPVKNVQVGSQVSGIIREIHVDFNSKVTNGQLIAQIDPSTYEQNITQTEAELENAKAGLTYAELNYKRAKELREGELVSPADYEKAAADLQQAQAIVRTREASLKRARVDLEKTTIYAPIDGVVISRNVDAGQTVAASLNAPTLFLIANDLRQMRIEAMVSEADVGGIMEGQRVNFNVDAYPSRQFNGRVTQVRFAPITNQNVVSYTCVVDVDNADLKLRPGMTANPASIVTAEKRNVLRIPNSALRVRPPETALLKLTNSPAATTNAVPSPENRVEPGPMAEGGERPNREEMRKRFESMSPEEREQFRARMRERFGDGPPGEGRGPRGGGGGGNRGGMNDAPVSRTVYILSDQLGKDGKPLLKPHSIKTGATDGSYTEVLEGLKEDDVIVVSATTPGKATTAAPTGSTPFGNPGFGGGMRGPR